MFQGITGIHRKFADCISKARVKMVVGSMSPCFGTWNCLMCFC